MTHTFEPSVLLLEPIVKNLLDETAMVESFEMHALRPGVGNPTSLGVYRVSGVANLIDKDVPFSLVVKHLADGQPFMDASQPTNWNYFKREIAFFESVVASRIPASIGYPKYLGQTALSDGTFLFWNEDLGDLTKSKWTWQSCLTAVRLVAELNSIDISDAADHNWLSEGTTSGWLDFRDRYFVPAFEVVQQVVATDSLRAEKFKPYGYLIPQQVRLRKVITDARQTFVHGDFNLNNLVMVPEREYELVALDWQLCGVSGLGTEVAPIFGTAFELGVISGTKEEFEELCAAYVEKFNELNPDNPASLNEVRLVAAAMGFSIINAISSFFVWPDFDPTKELPKENVEKMLDDLSSGIIGVYAEVLHELL